MTEGIHDLTNNKVRSSKSHKEEVVLDTLNKRLEKIKNTIKNTTKALIKIKKTLGNATTTINEEDSHQESILLTQLPLLNKTFYDSEPHTLQIRSKINRPPTVDLTELMFMRDEIWASVNSPKITLWQPEFVEGNEEIIEIENPYGGNSNDWDDILSEDQTNDYDLLHVHWVSKSQELEDLQNMEYIETVHESIPCLDDMLQSQMDEYRYISSVYSLSALEDLDNFSEIEAETDSEEECEWGWDALPSYQARKIPVLSSLTSLSEEIDTPSDSDPLSHLMVDFGGRGGRIPILGTM